MFHQRMSKLLATVSLVVAVTLGMVHDTRGQATQTTPRTIQTPAKSKAKAKTLIDLNKATAKELEDTLPGVGEATARKIVAGRPYQSVEDLAKAGVPARTIQSIRPLVTVGRPAAAKAEGATRTAAKPVAPVNLNTADVTTLETLPGIGPVHAKAIVAGRPYKSVDDLEHVKGLGTERINALRKLVTTESPSPAPAATRTAAKSANPATRTPTRSKTATKPASGTLIDLNTATKEELDALPGIGPVKAQAIIDARPFKTIEDVMKVKGIKEGEFSKIKDRITVR